MKYSPTEISRQFKDWVVEAGEQNTGLMVESIQHWSGGNRGDSWCAYTTLFVLDICFGGKSKNPLIRSGRVQDIYDQAQREGWVVTSPRKDDIYIFINSAGHAHHIGFITSTVPITGISGNTSPDGKSSNGNGWYEHELFSKDTAYIRYPQ